MLSIDLLSTGSTLSVRHMFEKLRIPLSPDLFFIGTYTQLHENKKVSPIFLPHFWPYTLINPLRKVGFFQISALDFGTQLNYSILDGRNGKRYEKTAVREFSGLEYRGKSMNDHAIDVAVRIIVMKRFF